MMSHEMSDLNTRRRVSNGGTAWSVSISHSQSVSSLSGPRESTGLPCIWALSPGNQDIAEIAGHIVLRLS